MKTKLSFFSALIFLISILAPTILFAGSAEADTNLTNLAFGATGNATEMTYMYDNQSNGVITDRRFADATAYWTYKFDLADNVTEAFFDLDISGQYKISASIDNVNWNVLASTSNASGRTTVTVNVSNLLIGNPSKIIYLKFSDAVTSDGFGPSLYYLTLRSSTTGITQTTFKANGNPVEMAYMYDDYSNGIINDHRFADTTAFWTYSLNLDDTVTEAFVDLDISGNYVVSASADKVNWVVLANAGGVSERSLQTVNLTNLLIGNPTKTVYLKFYDGTTSDGFGPSLYSLTLRTSTTGVTTSANFDSTGNSIELAYMYDNQSNGVISDHRFADTTAYWIYKFDLSDNIPCASLELDISGGYLISGSVDGENWITLADAGGAANRGVITADITSLLSNNPSKIVYVKFNDRTPSDGFGPSLYHLSLKEDTSMHLFGTLMSETQFLDSDWSNGVRIFELELNWAQYEPSDGVWDQNYIATIRNLINTVRSKGMLIELDFGMQSPPSWVCNIENWVDQDGNINNTEINTWNTTVQNKMARHIKHVFADFGTDFYSVRVGSGNEVETLYPQPVSPYKYWAWSPSARQQWPSNLNLGWKPGDPSPNGEAQIFYNWYVNHLVDMVNFQHTEIRKWYQGHIMQLFPGLGIHCEPNLPSDLISYNLVPSSKYPSDYAAAETGADYETVIDNIAIKDDRLIITCSSLNDGSAINADESSPSPDYWSSAHWIAYLADRYGLKKSGENKGHDDYSSMQLAFNKFSTYGYRELSWAWDGELYWGGSYATAANYQSEINANP